MAEAGDGSRELSYREKGTPQGGYFNPGNIYLHEVLDKWFAHEVKARLKGRAFLVDTQTILSWALNASKMRRGSTQCCQNALGNTA
jgi:hypothetical protein